MSSSENESYSSAAIPGANAANAMQPPMDDGSGGSGGPRKRVSQACVPCAKRKTKCDGALPTCGQCLQRDIQDCVYTTSRRNKRARKSSPMAYSFHRPSFGFDDQSKFYSSNEANRDHEYPFQQESLHQGFTAMDVLAHTSASRAPPSNMIVPRNISFNTLTVPATVSVRLLKDFFATIHPMWPILYKPMFDTHDDLRQSMAPALLYAIYSIAACIQSQTPEEDSFQTPMPSKLFEAALTHLQQPASGNPAPPHPLHLLKPSIESCQAITILALQQHGVGEASSAAILFGLAAAMATELKLHRAMGPGADMTEVQIRSRLWWNIYVLDKMMASEIKRPVILRSEETDTPFPAKTEADEFQLLSLRVAGQNHSTTVKTHTISGFHTTIQIVMIMEKVCRDIYSITGREAIREGIEAIEETRMRLWQELKDYNDMLDHSPLKLDLHSGIVPAPVTITNMVWMYCSTILLHRPFASQQVRQSEKKSKNLLHPLDICFVASNNICDILEGYADNLPKLSCDMIFPIFTTGSTLSHYSKLIDREDPLTQRRIDMCIRWLQILGKSWKNAGPRQQLLAKDFHPQEISRPGSIPYRTSTPHANPSGHLTPAFGSSTPAPLQNEAKDVRAPVEDWTFLDNFGDATDEFYSMDTDFREMLQNQVDSGHGHGHGHRPISSMD